MKDIAETTSALNEALVDLERRMFENTLRIMQMRREQGTGPFDRAIGQDRLERENARLSVEREGLLGVLVDILLCSPPEPVCVNDRGVQFVKWRADG